MVVQGKSAGDQIFDIVNVLLVLLLTLIFLYPMWFVFVASISNPARLMVHTGIMLWPDGFSLEGYREVFTDPDVLTGYLNTLFYVGVGTVFSMFMTTLGAYVTSRKDFYFRKLMLPFIVLTM